MAYREEYKVYPCSGKKYNGEKAIISLTSWKARINTVSKTISSLINTCPGFHIVLVLSEEEFPNREFEMPKNLLSLAKSFELLWVFNNYKCFKKLLFTMDKYIGIPIISADDDCIYNRNYAQILFNSWQCHKNFNITNNGMPLKKYGVKWGRGPNTLFSQLFSTLCHKHQILTYLQQLEPFNRDDDSFYGVISEKFGIDYIDLKTSQFYNSHDSIKPFKRVKKPLHKQSIANYKQVLNF